MILALAGGVGGAKLVCGLAGLLPAEELTVVVNTGDDFVHCGLHISPDIDTVMYTLADRNNSQTGWGLAGETWSAFGALERLGGPAWFQLGDQDLATHLQRTQLLATGATLSEATQALCLAFGLSRSIAPMSDQTVRTIVHTSEGALEFQHYFVRRRCEPELRRVEFFGAESAGPSPAFSAALCAPLLDAVIICPSNPYLSIAPILGLSGVREQIKALEVPLVVVSPIIGGKAVKGPTAKIMRELGCEPSSLEVARFYSGIADGIVIDECDQALAYDIEALGLSVHVVPTLMRSRNDQLQVAQSTLNFASTLRQGSRSSSSQ